MRHLSVRRKRVASLLGAGALLIGGVGAPALLAAAPASATTCATGTACTIAGTATLGVGTLSVTTPDTFTWAGTLNGLTQDLVDTVPADETYNVDDATGAATGWNVSVSATQFTSTTPTAATLPDAGTFSTNGSITSATAATAPTASCTSGAGSCTLPTDAVTYPVAVTTGAAVTPVIVYSAAATTGVGSIDIGGSTAAAPVGWWLALTPTAVPGTYLSTITVNLGTGPT
jgi:hypothetical protein